MIKIPEIKLNNGKSIPALGLGTWQLKGAICINSVKGAIEIGYNHIDTAEIYGNEEEVGRAIKETGTLRKELFITSKKFPFQLTYNSVIKSCEKSLKKLSTDYLDLYLLHWPKRKKNMKYLEAFKKLLDEGKIKSFGVSNFTIHHLKDILPITESLGLKISVNQVEFHPLLYQKELLEFCKEKNIVMTAYSPLARGMVYENDILREIGIKYNKTPGQISLRWLLQKNLVVIPKASSEKHLAENINVFDFKLKEEDIKKIDSISERKRLINPPFFGDFNY
jgi:2,5-diketo-D-gluconate reductase B